MRQTVFVVVMTLLPCLSVFAQTRLDGYIVSSTTRQPIESAYSQICQLSDSLVVAFARSDASGAFELTFSPETGRGYFLKVSHISYKTVLLPLSTNTNQPIKVEMQPGNLVLNEVQVTAQIPIREQGDSTRYKVDAFRNGSEQTLEQVLKKMPNVRVEENGDIYFKNKKVEKVFLDGDDLVGNAYQLATRSINPAVLNEVQAIEHFSENKRLQKIEQSEQTVLNLTVKDDRKTLLFGSLNVGVGPQRYNGTGNLFSYSKTVKAFAVLSANNTGIQRLEFSDASASVLTDDRPATDLLIRPYSHTAQPFPRNLNTPLENLNNERVGTFNAAFNPTNKLKITANLSLLQDRVQAGRSQAYQLIGNVPLTYQQTDTLRQQPSLAHLRIQTNYDISPRTGLLYRAMIGGKTIDLAQTTQFVTGGEYSWFPQQFANRLTDTRHVLELTHKIKSTNVFVLSAQATHTRLTERYAAQLNSLFARALFLDTTGNGNLFNQVVEQDNQLYSSQLRWLYGTKTRKFEQQLGYQYNHFGADLTQQSGRLSLGGDTLNFVRQTFYSRTMGKLVWSAFELSGFVQFNNVTAQLNGQQAHQTPIQANVSATFKLGKLSSLVLAYDRQASIMSNSYLINRPIVTDFRSAQQGQRGLLFDNRDQLALSYMFTDITRRRMTFFATAFTVRSNTFWNFGDLRFTPDYSISSLINTPDVYTNGLGATLEKLVYPLSGNIRLITNVIQVQARQLVSGQERNSEIVMPSITAKYISVFNSPFNMEVGGTYRQTKLAAQQTDQSFQQTFTASTGYTTLFYRKKNNDAAVTAELSRIQQNHYFFLKAHLNHQFNPKLSIRLEGSNLLNQTSYRQVTITPTVYSQGVFPLLPRMILLYTQYSF